MLKQLQLQVSPATANNEILLKEEVAIHLGFNPNISFTIKILKRSIDARNRNIKINLTLVATIDEAIHQENIHFNYLNVSNARHSCHIIGAGPAGLFAALRCLELGIKPIIIESIK